MPAAAAAPVDGTSSSASAPPPPPSRAPARTRNLFYRLDADADGRITREQLLEGFGAEFGREIIPRVDALFDEHAIGDLAFSERYVDKIIFNVFYAEALFDSHDADADGLLTHAQAQAALQFLTRRPSGDAPKPQVLFACPPDAPPDPVTGELRMHKRWFGGLYKNMA